MKLLVSLFAVLLFTESCNSTKTAMKNEAVEQTQPTAGYIVKAFDGYTSFPSPLTLSFDSTTNRVSGSSGCNNFFGTYTISENTISFGQMAATKKMCMDDTVNVIENKFLSALNKVNAFQVKGNTLQLLHDGTTIIEADKVLATSSTPKKTVMPSDITKDVTKPSPDTKGQKELSVVYKATSRGSFEYVAVSPSKVFTSTDRNLDEMTTLKTETKDWQEIEQLLKTINPKQLEQLKSPTNKRLFDGAAHATLTFNKGKESITTPSFDHGHPPKVIEALVNKVLSMAQPAKKQ